MRAPFPDAVIVFGASGFVGRNIVAALSGRVTELVGITNSASSVAGCTRVIRVSDLASLPVLPRNTVAIHVAAFRYDAARFELAQSDILRNNVDLATNFYHFCAERHISEVRLASSIAVYSERLPILDDGIAIDLNTEPYPHEAFYGWSKRWTEVLSDLYFAKFGINTLTFRLSNPYGPYDSTDPTKAHVAPAFVMKALSAAPEFEIRGDAAVTRDFTFVGDIATAFVRSLEMQGCHDKFNLCRGQTSTLLELAKITMQVAGASKPIRSGMPGAFGPASRAPTSARIKSALGIEFLDLESGMRPTIEWYRRALAR